ncbi:MAG: sialidase family protein [Egibacteraceae bacterium]
MVERGTAGTPATGPPQPRSSAHATGDDGGDPSARQGRAGSWLAAAVGIALVLIGAGLLVLSASLDDPPQAALAGGNLPINAGAGDPLDQSGHNSPVVTRNPTDPANIVVGNRLDSPDFACALHVSTDGGATFEETRLPEADPQGKCYAPQPAFAADGTLHVAFVTLRGTGNRPHRVWLASSDDGGQTLSEPSRLLGELAFQVGLTADPDDADRLYLTWLEAEETATLAFPDTGYPLRLMSSDDGGVSWTEPVTVSDPDRARVVAPTLAVGAAGVLHLLYLDLGDDRLDWAGGHEGRGGPPYPGTWELVAARSGDEGRTWSETTVDAFNPPTRILVFLPDVPSLAVDRERGRVYAAFHARHHDDADVFVWRSTDNGETWSSPVRVNDTDPADGTAQYLPALDVAPSGRVDVVYYDRRDGADENVMNAVSLAFSHDAGATFTDRLVLSDRPFDSRVGFGGFRGMADLGSRLGLLSTPDRALAVWSDTRAGTEVSEKQDLVRQFATFARSISSPVPPSVLRGVAGVSVLLGLVGVGGRLGGKLGRQMPPR